VSASRDLPTPRHPNAARILAAKHAVTPGRDLDPLLAVQAPDLVAHIPGTSPIAGEWHSRDALAAAVRGLGARAGDTRRIAPHVAATDAFAIDVQRVTARRPDGRALDAVLTEGWRLHGGVCVELRDHFEDLAAWDAFWR
jgi:ketosteroid isomerase-like protein